MADLTVTNNFRDLRLSLGDLHTMQNVPPKGTGSGSGGGYQGNSISPNCQDGALANILAAMGSAAGSRAGGDALGGIAGSVAKDVGGAICTVIDPILDAKYVPVSNGEDADSEGDGAQCTAPTGPDLTGGYCVDPDEGGASQTTYVDPTTGETVTNTADASTAGDANATGTYIGEADDPNFANDQSDSTGGSSGSGQTSNSDTSASSTSTEQSSSSDSTQSTQQTDDSDKDEATQSTDSDPKPGSDNMPSDDGSDSPRYGGPVSYVSMGNLQNVAAVVNLQSVVLSRAMLH
jgi:hypothetical protein